MTKTKDLSFPILKTQRLNLRKLLMRDQQDIFKLRSDKQVLKHLLRAPHNSIAETVEFIDRITAGIEEKKWSYWVITLRDNNIVIGTICLWNFSSDKTIADIGYELMPDFQNKGYATEAVKEIIKFGFKDLNLQKILAKVSPENLESIKLLKKFEFDLSDQQDKNNKILMYELNQNKK